MNWIQNLKRKKYEFLRSAPEKWKRNIITDESMILFKFIEILPNDQKKN